MRQRFPPLFAASILLLLLAACEETGPPTINYLKGETSVNSSDSALFECQAWDWNDAPVWFEWACSRGSLVVETEEYYYQQVKWFAPESSGSVALRVRVVDEDNEVTTDSLVVNVRRVTKTRISFSAAVKAELFREWRDSLRTSHSVRCEFSVEDSNRLSFYVMDDSNYGLWLDGQPFEALASRESSPEDTFTVRVPRTDWYHYVMDNTEGKQDREFWLRVRTTTP